MSTTTPTPAESIAVALREFRRTCPLSPFGQALTDEVIEQAARGPQTDAALREWLEKTEWVQKIAQPHELGKHRADVLSGRIERLIDDLAAAKREVESLRRACDVFRAQLEAAGTDRRDRFIAAALAGISAHTIGPKCNPGESPDEGHARWAVAVANAVMRKVGA